MRVLWWRIRIVRRGIDWVLDRIEQRLEGCVGVLVPVPVPVS